MRYRKKKIYHEGTFGSLGSSDGVKATSNKRKQEVRKIRPQK